mgnify:CR=1 FL=1
MKRRTQKQHGKIDPEGGIISVIPKHLIWNLQPKIENWATVKAVIWTTTCNKYRILYLLHKYPGANSYAKDQSFGVAFRESNSWIHIEHSSPGPGYPKYYITMEEGLDAITRYSQLPQQNREELLKIQLIWRRLLH